MRMLDIGCGWGGLVKYAAERYQAEAGDYGVRTSGDGKRIMQGVPGWEWCRITGTLRINLIIISVGDEHVGYKLSGLWKWLTAA
jgi:hypothetical protein